MCIRDSASAKYEYIYSCTEPYGQARHHLRLSQRGRHYEIARFAVKQHVFYYFSSSDVTVLVKECDWSLRVDPHIGHRIPTSPHHIVELVSIKSAAVTYVRYDRTLMKAIVETTFTNSMTRTWNVRTFGDVRNSSMMHRMNAPFSPSCQITPLERLLDYNERTMLDEYGDPWLRLESIDSQLRKLSRPVQETSWRKPLCLKEAELCPYPSFDDYVFRIQARPPRPRGLHSRRWRRDGRRGASVARRRTRALRES